MLGPLHGLAVQVKDHDPAGDVLPQVRAPQLVLVLLQEEACRSACAVQVGAASGMGSDTRCSRACQPQQAE